MINRSEISQRRYSRNASIVVCEFLLLSLSASPVGSRTTHPRVTDISNSRGGEVSRGWTPRDSARVRYFVGDFSEPFTLWDFFGADGRTDTDPRGISFSPDRSMFFTVERHGVPETNQTVFTLIVYDVDRLRQWMQSSSFASRELEVVRFSATVQFKVHQAAIDSPRWRADGRAIFFRALIAERHYEGFELDVSSGRARQITATKQGVRWFESRGRTSLHWGLEIEPGSVELRYPYQALERELGNSENYPIPRQTVRSWTPFHILKSHSARFELPPYVDGAISPDGRFAAITSAASESVLVIEAATGRSIAELPLGSVRPPVAGGKARHPIYFWSADSRDLITVGVPANGTKERRAQQSLHPDIGVYSLNSRTWSQLRTVPWSIESCLLRWQEQESILTIESCRNEPTRSVVAERVDKLWNVTLSEAKVPADSITFQMDESENVPVRLTANYKGNRRTVSLADPALKSVRWNKVRRFEWLDSKGVRRTWGLILPGASADRAPFPFVIQLSYDRADVFRPDGLNSTSHYAQAIAARGMAVLTVDTSSDAVTSDPEEGALVADIVETAIDELAIRGVIDPYRVALSGFSRTGYQTHYLVTHPVRTPFAAAIVADAWTGSWAAYLEDSATADVDGTYMHGRKFWDTPTVWLQNEVTFNADRAFTPTLFTENLASDEMPLTAARTVGAWQANRKPYDYLFFPWAGHNLTAPAQRVGMVEATVDWFAFWLLGVEDLAPGKSEQYARWRQIKAQATIQEEIGGRLEIGPYIRTRSGLKVRIEKRTRGRLVQPSSEVDVTYRLDGAEITKTVRKLSGKRLNVGDAASDRRGLPALDECLSFLRAGEMATCIYPSGADRSGTPSGTPASDIEGKLWIKVEAVR